MICHSFFFSLLRLYTGACDTLAQKWAEPDSELDFQRIVTFTFFCVGYVGSFQHILFSRIYPRIFPGEGLGVAVKKVRLWRVNEVWSSLLSQSKADKEFVRNIMLVPITSFLS